MLTKQQIITIQKAFNGTGQRAIFKILGDTNRYRIFEMLAEKERIAVGDIAKILKVSIPLASQHLKILEQAKILKKEKIGRKVYYAIETKNKIAMAIFKTVL
jgi:ArsR family transcriptional regulator